MARNFLNTLYLPRHRRKSRSPSPLPAREVYEYEPFFKDREIRVVRLLPGVKKDHLACQLIPVPLEGTPITYTALSYVWGNPNQSHFIICEGKHIPITKALHTALLYLRGENGQRELWIDQLSINQRDNVERSKQVSIMADIYRLADKVIIWLGEESKNVDAAFKLTARLVPIIQERGSGQSYGDDELKELGLPTHMSKDFDALGAVLKMPWFRRAWVVQEASMTVSATLCCGSSSMPWQDFALAVSRLRSTASRRYGGLYTYNGSPAERVGQMLQWSHWRVAHGVKAESFKLFTHIKNCDATDPRDKLYAFLNLGNLKTKPDYSVPATVVYIHFALDFLQRALNNDRSTWSTSEDRATQHRVIAGFLCNAGKLCHHLDLPSWVPDWSYRQNCRPFWSTKTVDTKETQLAYSAGNEIMGECDLDGTRLRVSAILLDTVTQAGRVDLTDTWSWTEKQLQKTCLAWFSEAAAMHMALPVHYRTGETRNEAMMQTLVAGLDMDNSKATHNHAFNSYWHFQSYIYERWDGLLVPKATLSERNEMGSFPVVSTILGRVFFITQQGYMGLAPYGVQPGDEIAVMLGCDIPLLLRRQGHGLGGPEFHLQGECFVHGIMFGEAVRSQDLAVASIVLR